MHNIFTSNVPAIWLMSLIFTYQHTAFFHYWIPSKSLKIFPIQFLQCIFLLANLTYWVSPFKCAFRFHTIHIMKFSPCRNNSFPMDHDLILTHLLFIILVLSANVAFLSVRVLTFDSATLIPHFWQELVSKTPPQKAEICE